MFVFILHPEPQLNGCHPEPQLKECHMFTLYPEPQLKRYHSEPQLKECSSKSIFKVFIQCLVDHTSQEEQRHCPSVIVWRCLSVAKGKPVADRLVKPSGHQAPHAYVVSSLSSIVQRNQPHHKTLQILVTLCDCSYRSVVQPSSPGATLVTRTVVVQALKKGFRHLDPTVLHLKIPHFLKRNSS